jgi:hypothetical protein
VVTARLWPTTLSAAADPDSERHAARVSRTDRLLLTPVSPWSTSATAVQINYPVRSSRHPRHTRLPRRTATRARSPRRSRRDAWRRPCAGVAFVAVSDFGSGMGAMTRWQVWSDAVRRSHRVPAEYL